jgi:uncharacterized RDD family membrane protein YckC
LVTGEAVVLELRLAKLPSRALAITIDITLQLVVLIGLIALSSTASVDNALFATVGLVTVVLVLVGFPTAIETLTRGRSLGKLAIGLRVVRDDGGPVGFRQSLVRALAGFFIDFWLTFGVGAIISSLASTKGKRVGDHFAGTVVIRERTPAQGGMVVAMPPALAAWAATLDLSRLPDDLALNARQFMSRATQLAPDVRASMGGRIAADVVARITPPPPPGAPPEAVLAAVLAERRARDYARITGQAQQPYGPPPSYGAPGYAPPPAYRPPGIPAPPAPTPSPETAQPPQQQEGGAFAPPS